MLYKFKLIHFKEGNTPFETNIKLQNNDGRVTVPLEYASVIDCLMYMMQCIRPDITFTVSKISRFTRNPNGEYWNSITIIFGYLLKNKNTGLHYGKFLAKIEGYTDASWIFSVGDHEYTIGWIFTLS